MKKQSTIFCSIIYFGILLLILYTYPPTIEYYPLTQKTEFDNIYSTECVKNNDNLINNLGKKCVEQHNNKTCSLYNKQPVYRCSSSSSKTYPDRSQAGKNCKTSLKTSLLITDGMESCIEDGDKVYYETNGDSDKTYIVNNSSNNRISSTWNSSGYYGKHVEYITSEGCAPNERRAICKKTLPS